MKAVIVCIDDEPALCNVVRAILRRLGLHVEAFTDPASALAYLRAGDVDLVLCDYRMPSMNGLEVLAAIEREVPFVMVSGDLEIDRLCESEPRVSAVVPKPFQPEELIALVHRLVPALGAVARR